MPARNTPPAAVPTLIGERLVLWGRCIRAQRLAQRITARELAERSNLSRATLQRLERGDPGASAAAYFRVLMVLGLLDEAVPSLPAQRWSVATGRRAVRRAALRAADGDDWF